MGVCLLGREPFGVELPFSSTPFPFMCSTSTGAPAVFGAVGGLDLFSTAGLGDVAPFCGSNANLRAFMRVV
eukprot:2386990-Rhodomonas_salina.1